MSYMFKEFYVPERMRISLENYVKYGTVSEGSFMWYLLVNDFKAICAYADDENLRNLPAFAMYICNQMPAACQGSVENVVTWVKGHLHSET